MTKYPRPAMQGRNPVGRAIATPIAGTAWLTTVALGVSGSVTSPWLSNASFPSLLYVIRSDQASATNGIVVEYSDDGVTAIAGGAGIAYTAAQIGMQIQRALVPKGAYTRIRYTNGTIAQTAFRLEIIQSPALIQPTEGSLNVAMTDSALATYSVADVQLSDGTSYQRIGRVADAAKVSVANLPTSYPVTGTVALDAPTLAAIAPKATQPVSIATLPPASWRAGQIQLADGTWTDVLTAYGEKTLTLLALNGTGTLVAGITGKKIRVVGWRVGAAAAITFNFASNATQIGAKETIAAGVSHAAIVPCGYFSTATGESLNYSLSGSVALLAGVTVFYVLT